ncbi:hypothetical protein SAMN05216223_11541 [Actinacidiphila yanglinensis]|uniref:Leucine rich repeat variant n=1 Tax=Actinacidiphila yanglinensis TaxID=310779 RepID=A0A1H6DFW9_9ACTN|nr:hypothetical protein [Actinacidiphila yanglinensis]SEG84278.1 hypothetical protein SAMN05216223_11541 [Actinacidiphila yanglinensis]
MPSSPLAEMWLRGVAANPAAPSEVLLRLLAPAAGPARKILCEERGLPPDVIDAVIAHPERAVRRGLARNRHVSPGQRGRLVNDPDAFVRNALASGPRPRVGRVDALPDDVLEILLTRQDDAGHGQLLTADEIRQELEVSGQISQAFRCAMPEHENPELRRRAAGLWLWLTPLQRDALLADPVPAVREAARVHSRVLDPEAMEADLPERDCHGRSIILVNYAVSRSVAEACLASGRDLWSLAHNRHTPADVVARLARDPDPVVRQRVAGRADLDPSVLAELANDPEDAVRTRALVHPLPRTWAQRDAIDQVIGRTAEVIGPIAERRTTDTDWYAACAASAHPLLRRVAATCSRLPEELVNRLADDPDPEVRHLLAYHHPCAPPETILDAFLATPRQRPHLLALPGFPRTGLQLFLDHEDPEVRALAAADSTWDQPPVRLLTDPEASVRGAAAANPLLPPDQVSALLAVPDTAEGAAANPILPAERLHELLTASGLT